MANQNPTGTDTTRCLTTYDEDEREQRAVLRFVLEFYPATLTQDELLRELTSGGSKEHSASDAIGRAIRDLVASGLLHSLGEDQMLRPTRAAMRHWELTGGAS